MKSLNSSYSHMFLTELEKRLETCPLSAFSLTGDNDTSNSDSEQSGSEPSDSSPKKHKSFWDFLRLHKCECDNYVFYGTYPDTSIFGTPTKSIETITTPIDSNPALETIETETDSISPIQENQKEVYYHIKFVTDKQPWYKNLFIINGKGDNWHIEVLDSTVVETKQTVDSTAIKD